uniref:Uncharacterized protein n=1 Tax=Nelumbo nucifera TaxID=4432 RepID=A0A822XU23_NELNU|nr:TPA_asm: hypothetical protein HUJ06_023788 [Nelumbo nucifera]
MMWDALARYSSSVINLVGDNIQFFVHLHFIRIYNLSSEAGRLNAEFKEAKAELEARIRDSMFFQVASDGWKPKVFGNYGGENVVNLIVKLPSRTSLFQRVLFTNCPVPSKYAEEILWETIIGICGSVVWCNGDPLVQWRSQAVTDN